MSTEGAGAGARPGAPLDEVREDEAPAGTRAIYAQIKRATGIPQVNLIFRHLARDPAMLAWAWETVAPLYRSGAIAAAADRLEPVLAAPSAPPLWQALEDRRPDEAARLQAVLAFYDRGNRWNLLGLTALLRAGERPARSGVQSTAIPAAAPQAATKAGPGGSAPQPGGRVPPLPRRQAVGPELMALVDDLAARHGSAAVGVVPSLYLHLTHWPEAVRAAHERVAPILGTTEWRRRVDALTAAARGLAEEMARELGTAVPAPAEHVRTRYLGTVRDFVEGTIPQMVLVGRILSGGAAPDRKSAIGKAGG